MTREYARKKKQSSQKETKDNSILQRTAVRSLPAKPKTPQVQRESPAGDRPGVKLDLMQIPLSDRSAMPVQAKLEIGPADDKYEREADRAAKQVVQQLQGPQSDQGQEKKEVEEEQQRKPMLQLKGDEVPMAVAPELESAIARSRGSGEPISDRIREPMEKAFGGVDFSRVKIHADETSDRLNQSIQAKAFTTGQDVFFRQGAYNPGSQGGKELLAHELTHVVQQNSGSVQRQIVQCNGDDDRKKNRLEPSKFKSQYVRDAIRDRAEARDQGITVDEIRAQKQEERLRGFRASLTGLYPEELDRLREQLNAAETGLEQDRAKMIEIIEEENILHHYATQIASRPVANSKTDESMKIMSEKLEEYRLEINKKDVFYRFREYDMSKKKGLKKIYEPNKSKDERKAEQAKSREYADDYEKQFHDLTNKQNQTRIVQIMSLKDVRRNKNVKEMSEAHIKDLTDYVEKQIKTAGSEFDVSKLNELAGYLNQEITVRLLLLRIAKEGVQSFYTTRQKIKETIEKLQKEIEELRPGKFEGLIEKIKPNKEREQLIAQGQEQLKEAREELEYLNSVIELIEAPRYKERVEQNESNSVLKRYREP